MSEEYEAAKAKYEERLKAYVEAKEKQRALDPDLAARIDQLGDEYHDAHNAFMELTNLPEIVGLTYRCRNCGREFTDRADAQGHFPHLECSMCPKEA